MDSGSLYFFRNAQHFGGCAGRCANVGYFAPGLAALPQALLLFGHMGGVGAQGNFFWPITHP